MRLGHPCRILPAALWAAVLLALAPAAFADAPEWLRAVARQPVPLYPSNVEAVVLLDEQTTTVNEKGEIKTVYRRAIKILSTRGRDRGTVGVSFDKDTKLNYLRAWCIPAEGKEFEAKDKDAIETALGDGSLYVDNRARILRIPAADPGNIIGYEYEQKQRPYVLEDQWWFQAEDPVRRARYNLTLPDGWGYQAAWRNFKPVDSLATNEFEGRWELTNVPPLHIEPAMPARSAVRGRLIVTLYPSRQSLRNKSLRSWSDVGSWYTQLSTGRRDVTPEIKQKAGDLTANAPNTLAKIQALAAFAQRDIRYVSIQIGIGGYQPHEAQAILTNRYGDCKDKVTLLSSLLSVIGIESYYVLVHTDRGVVAPEVPSAMSFNHVILAMRLPADVDPITLYASRPHDKFGRILYFDPTDDMTPIGYLPGALQASYGLFVHSGTGEMIELPLLAPATNRLLRVGKFSLSPAGVLDGEVQEVRWGAPAVTRRTQLLQVQASERPKILERFLGSFLTGFSLTRADVEGLDDRDKALTLRFRFVAENYAKSAGNLLLFRPRILDEKGDDLLERSERKYPVEFDTATVHTDTYEFTLPTGYVVDELPPPFEVDYSFASYKSSIEVKDNVLRYNRTYQIKTVQVPSEKLPDLKKLYRQIAADERASAVLRRVSN